MRINLTSTVRGLMFAGIFLSGTASAVPVFTQGPMDGGDSFYSSLDGGSQNADDFTLSTDAFVNSLSWWGTSAGSGSGDFTLRLFGMDSGSPVAASVQTLTGSVSRSPTSLLDSGSAEIFRYDFTTSLTLGAGSYALSISSENAEAPWFWQTSATGDGGSFFRGDDGDDWGSASGNMAFSVDATPSSVDVPEPGTMALFAIALSGAALLTRRRSLRPAR